LIAQQPFGIKPWQQFNACLALPSSSGAFRFDLAYESLESFRSYQFGISYAHRLHQAWYAGLGFRFQQMRTTGYPQKAEPGYELAILWNPIPDLAFSSSLLGFSSGKGSSIQQSWWPQEFRAGCFFRFSRSTGTADPPSSRKRVCTTRYCDTVSTRPQSFRPSGHEYRPTRLLFWPGVSVGIHPFRSMDGVAFLPGWISGYGFAMGKNSHGRKE
jgi:hypothetical protein